MESGGALETMGLCRLVTFDGVRWCALIDIAWQANRIVPQWALHSPVLALVAGGNIAIEDATTYEAMCLLHKAGWGWNLWDLKQFRQGGIPLEYKPGNTSASGGKPISFRYLQALLRAEDVTH